MTRPPIGWRRARAVAALVGLRGRPKFPIARGQPHRGRIGGQLQRLVFGFREAGEVASSGCCHQASNSMAANCRQGSAESGSAAAAASRCSSARAGSLFGQARFGQTQFGLTAEHRTVGRAVARHGTEASKPGQRRPRLRKVARSSAAAAGLRAPRPTAAKTFRRRSATRCRRPPADRPAAPQRTRRAAIAAAGLPESSRTSAATVAAASGNPSSTGVTPGGAALSIPIGTDKQKPEHAAAEHVQPGVGGGIRDWGLGIGDWRFGDLEIAGDGRVQCPVHSPLSRPPPCLRPLTPDP